MPRQLPQTSQRLCRLFQRHLLATLRRFKLRVQRYSTLQLRIVIRPQGRYRRREYLFKIGNLLLCTHERD